MSLIKTLGDFDDSILGATTRAPDEYDSWSYMTYETHMTDLKELWAAIRPQLKRDLVQAQWVDQTLTEMIAAFDAGEKKEVAQQLGRCTTLM